MKKAMFLLLAFMVGCSCIGQIPPQTIFVNENCEAVLPDYRENVTVRDNCPGVIIRQQPNPGSVLNADLRAVTVVISAIDTWGNETNVEFEVVSVDTIYPTIEADSTLLTHDIEDIGIIVKAAHLAMGRYMTDSYNTMADSLKTEKYFGNLPEHWKTYGMVLLCPPGGVGDYTGTLWRGATYACPCDSSEGEQLVRLNLPL